MESAGVEVWQNVCYGGCSRVGQDILMGQDRTGFLLLLLISQM